MIKFDVGMHLAGKTDDDIRLLEQADKAFGTTIRVVAV